MTRPHRHTIQGIFSHQGSERTDSVIRIINSDQKLARYHRFMSRSQLRFHADEQPPEPPQSSADSRAHDETTQDIGSSSSSALNTNRSTMTDYNPFHELDTLKLEVQVLKSERERLMQMILSPDSLVGNNHKVKYYTGLPSYEVFKVIFEFVAPCFQTYSRTVLPVMSQFLMVLVRLRLNMDIEQLSFMFGIHESNVSRVIRKWLDVLYERLGPALIRWPEREELMLTMPKDFKAFGKCIVIIDCFEVFMERPSALKSRAQTWSNYKHHNTCKFLIGITPQGSINSFISQAWGGRVSDVHLTEQCGLLDHLLPGDLILADRGFTIHDVASQYQCQVKVPSFTKGKAQLSRYEVDTTRELARVRIHVERVIGMLRQKYRILGGTLPVSLLMCDQPDGDASATDDAQKECNSMIDKIVVVCAALCNCCDSIIPFD